MRFSLSQISPQVWKNGGGSTRELAREDTAKGHMIWRASLARIDRDGAFSNFPGLSRILCIVSGAGLQLSNADVQLVAEPLKPLHFDGGLDLTAWLRQGACEAFNLIYDPDRMSAEMKICDAGRHHFDDGTQLIFVLEGSLRLETSAGVEQLSSCEGWQGVVGGFVDIAQDGRAVLLRLGHL